MKLDQRRFRHLLTSASAAAIIVALSPSVAVAVCSDVSSAGGFTNSSSPPDCIEVLSSLGGNLVNPAGKTIDNHFGATATSHAILVIGTISGSIQNSGSITASNLGGSGLKSFDIQAGGGSLILGGISNARSMTAEGTRTAAGIYIQSPTFAGGITNSAGALIQAISNRSSTTGNGVAAGIWV